MNKMPRRNDGNRTPKLFENLRYRLMWWIAPVNQETVKTVLEREVETWDDAEYDTARMLGNLLYLWDDAYFDQPENRPAEGDADA